MAALVVVVVKIVGDAGLGIGQVGKDEPIPSCEFFGFESQPQAFRLSRTWQGIVVALALPGTTASAVRELGLGGAQQGLVNIAHILPALPDTTSIGVDNQVRGRPLGLPPRPVAEFPQFDLKSARAIASFMVIENGDHFRFPGRLDRPYGLSRLPVTPGIVAAGNRAQNLAKLQDGVKSALLVNEVQCIHGVGGCEKLAMAFF